jgi:type I restriction enzyme S subunit
MKFVTKKIGEIEKILQTGKTPPSKTERYFIGGKINWYTPSDLDHEKYLTTSKRRISRYAVEEKKVYMVPPKSILIGCIGDIGKLGITSEEACSNQQITALVPTEEVDTEYLYYWLKQNKAYLEKKAKNAIVPILNNKNLREVKVKFPKSLTDQKRIAKVLSECEQLIAWRKESIQLLDDYLKSVFLEMFGDPAQNHKGFKVTTVKELIREAKYGTSKSAKGGGDLPYLRMNNINYDGYWDFTSLKSISLDDSEKEKYTLRKGDVVFNRTNSKELVGKTGIFDSDAEMVIAGYLIRIRVKENINPYYLWGHMNSAYTKKRLFNMCKSIVGMANINAQEVQRIRILNPPLTLQNEFAKVVEKVKEIKKLHHLSLLDLENLYSALSQKAFIGQLDLSKVVVDEETKPLQTLEETTTDISEENQQLKLKKAATKQKEKRDIRNMYLLDYYGVPFELYQHEIADDYGPELAFIGDDLFYQFYLKDNFPDRAFTFSDLQQAFNAYYIPKGHDFEPRTWKSILYKFMEGNKPLVEQIFDEASGTIKLKLTDEAFKA